jgi:hypothetical protein
LSTPVSPEPETSADAVAPAWHTFAVVCIMLAISGLSYYSQGLAPVGGRQRNQISSYVAAIVMEWLVFGFIWLGLRLRKQRMRILLGENWGGAKYILRDIGIGVLFLIASNLVLSLIGYLLKAAPNAAIRGILPQTPAQIAIYFLLTVTAGICEEIIFRGYLQRQFSFFFKNAAIGIVLQGLIFGASHGYQGPKYMLIIVVYGILFGALAQQRRSLRPGMIGHFLQDLTTGVVAGRFLR